MEKLLRISPRLIERRIKEAKDSWDEARAWFPNAPDFILGVARHPSQLYAACLEGVAVFLFVQWRFWRSNACLRAPGRLGGEFLLTYAIARIVGEFFREPDASLILGMSRGQFYSLFLLLGGIGVILCAERRSRLNA